MFQLLLALETGWTLEYIRKMPSVDYQRFRRLYAVCPFGPARGDMQAWLTAVNALSAWGGKLKPMHESVIWFAKPKKEKRKRQPKPKRRGVTSEQMRAWVLSKGGEVVENGEKVSR